MTAYTTRDRRQIYFAGIRTDKGFQQLAETIGHPELLDDARFGSNESRVVNVRALIAALDDIFAGQDLDHWVALLRGSGTPWAAVQTAANG